MYEVGVVATFSATHQLHGEFGPASQPHGHDYRVEARCAGPALQSDGTLLDITIVQAALGEVASSLSGRSLNELSELDARNPTAEVLAHYIWERLASSLAGRASHLRVTVWESPDAFASFALDLP
jgi:6-pyruvoyltetrahydropterin/6-carboxytetrahydropterin synthase